MAANWGASATAGGEVLQTKKVAGGAGAAGWGLSRTAGGKVLRTKKVMGGGLGWPTGEQVRPPAARCFKPRKCLIRAVLLVLGAVRRVL